MSNNESSFEPIESSNQHQITQRQRNIYRRTAIAALPLVTLSIMPSSAEAQEEPDASNIVFAESDCATNPDTEELNAYAFATIYNSEHGNPDGGPITVEVDIPFQKETLHTEVPYNYLYSHEGHSNQLQIPAGEATYTVWFDDGTVESGSAAYDAEDCNEDNPNPDPSPDPDPEPTPPPDTGGGEPIPIETIAGGDRYETAIEVSKTTFDSAEEVVLATGENYPDALAGGPLAAHLDAPLLLSQTGELPQSVADEINRLGAERVTMLGGEVALSTHVEQQLEDMGLSVSRVAGATRYATAAKIAGQFPISSTVNENGEQDFSEQNVFLVSGENFPDALSAGAPASRNAMPILLTSQEGLPDDTAEYLLSRHDHIDEIIVGGGAVAVSAAVESDAATLATAKPQRLAGGDRYETSVKFAEYDQRTQSQPTSTVHIATGRNFPDALTAGVSVAGMEGSAFVLVDGHDAQNANSTYEFLVNLDNDTMETVYIYGGEDAVTSSLRNRIGVATSS